MRDGEPEAAAHCCGSGPQRTYLRTLYRYFNRTRFGGRLPDDVPIRLSGRMTTSLGHIVPSRDTAGRAYVAEVAINVDLLLAGNGAERVDTLLHEMAHMADYLTHGNREHGRSWRRWARRVGCRPQARHRRRLVARRRRGERVTRVPPLPAALRPSAA